MTPRERAALDGLRLLLGKSMRCAGIILFATMIAAVTIGFFILGSMWIPSLGYIIKGTGGAYEISTVLFFSVGICGFLLESHEVLIGLGGWKWLLSFDGNRIMTEVVDIFIVAGERLGKSITGGNKYASYVAEAVILGTFIFHCWFGFCFIGISLVCLKAAYEIARILSGKTKAIRGMPGAIIDRLAGMSPDSLAKYEAERLASRHVSTEPKTTRTTL